MFSNRDGWIMGAEEGRNRVRSVPEVSAHKYCVELWFNYSERSYESNDGKRKEKSDSRFTVEKGIPGVRLQHICPMV